MLKRGSVPALLGLLVGACGEPIAPGQPIQVLDNTFVPSFYRAAVGDTVTWIWSGNNAHDVRFGDGGASSAVMTLGEFKRVFPTVGTFNYLCTLHGGMVGTIVVQ